MIVSSIHFTFAPEDADRAAAMFRELRDASVKEPGVVQFQVGRSVEKPHVFALWEMYRDQEAVEAHHGTEHFKRLVANGVRTLAKDRIIETVVPL
jgi:quinol monooxygenase YgiN